MSSSTRSPQSGRGFTHTALLYKSEDEFLDSVLRFTGVAVAAGHPAIVAVPPERHPRLEALLDPAVELWDLSEVGRNPTNLIAAFTEKIRSTEGPTHVVGECAWPGRSPEEVAEVIVHEALCNVAFEEGSVVGLCPYDASALDPDLIAHVKRTHPYIANGRGLSAGSTRGYENDAYIGRAAARSWRPPLPDSPESATRLKFDLTELRDVRAIVAEQAHLANLGDDRRADLVLAVNELATNSVRHAGGRGELRAWRCGDRLTFEVRDSGRMDDPLAGRLSPDFGSTQGRGLWLVNQLCQLVQIRSDDEATAVRVHEDVE